MPSSRGPLGLVVVVAATAAALLVKPCLGWSPAAGAGLRLWGMLPGRRIGAGSSSNSRRSKEEEGEDEKEVVLVLDVDGTLYDGTTGLEAQIISRIKDFVARNFNMSGEECDDLHHMYGSTVAGLQATRQMSEEMVRSFYDEVWSNLDYTGLLRPSPGSEGDKAGYRHRSPLSSLLSSHRGPLVLASNSPSHHIEKVLRHLGLASIAFHAIVTPDLLPGYPTKSDPSYWSPILSAFAGRDVVLVDDSSTNLRIAKEHGIRGVKVSKSVPVERAIASALGVIAPLESWSMDEGRYIREKNVVDSRAFNTLVQRGLEDKLKALRSEVGTTAGLESDKTKSPSSSPPPLCVVDLGAGLLSMLPRVMAMAEQAGWEAVDYTAYEMNEGLVTLTVDDLTKAGGFTVVSDEVVEAQAGRGGGCRVVVLRRDETVVKIIASDFNSIIIHHTSSPSSSPPHLVVGCCLADLYHPRDFVAMLLQMIITTTTTTTTTAGSSAVMKGGPLVYLPITFAGETRLQPSYRGDDEVFDAYHRHLTENEGHSLCPSALISAMQDHGATLLASGPATWVIDRAELGYLWECLVYFFGMGVCTAMGTSKTASWRQRLLRESRTIKIGNVDLLFQLGGTSILPPPLQPQANRHGMSSAKETTTTTAGSSIDRTTNTYVEFIGPRQVRSVVEEWVDVELGPDQVEVEAVCSLISSGTELKVYRGDFDKESAVDVNIKGMASETLKFPLRYGYSLVGRVVRGGVDVDMSRFHDRLVFAFAPHGQRHVLGQDQVILVPEGVAAEDAVYMPSMETALSIVQDAAPIAGERVAVVGTGLIGLLATAILSHTTISSAVTAIDPVARRREAARAVGATRAIGPQDVGKVEGLSDQDVSLELSGVASGLQTAIDVTGYGGKIVIGSWYGDKPVPLHLGLGFHRGHQRIIVSQVSNISAPLLDRWSKGRRFDLTWDLVRHLRPSGVLTTRVIKPEEAAAGYIALDQRPAEELAVMIRYSDNRTSS